MKTQTHTKMTRWTILTAILLLVGWGGCAPQGSLKDDESADPDFSVKMATPAEGCVSKPADFNIRLPFQDGEKVFVSAGYGENGGSINHWNCTDPNYAMDGQALDFRLDERPNRGLGMPVVAIASGTVVKEGWADAGWSPYGIRIYIKHDYNADGHTYISLYAHLNESHVVEGQTVAKGEIIGELGGSCTQDGEHKLDCPYMGPHLHFALHRDSHLGGSGKGGSYGGNGVVPEPFDGYTDLGRGQTLVAGGEGTTQDPADDPEQDPNEDPDPAEDPDPEEDPDPAQDPDPEQTACIYGNGHYCGATLGLDADTLYFCQNGNSTVVEVCVNGCHIADPGDPDFCEAPSNPDPDTCPYGNGHYCGSTLGLDNDTLYFCQNGNSNVVEVCAEGCHVAAPGDPDYCESAAADSCPFGNGLYCGTTLGLDTDTLYNCQNGNSTVVEVCADGCHIADPGFHDYCN
jgi:murein DD-endopeptidase MepM/ murein hydrolase activator NlpD